MKLTDEVTLTYENVLALDAFMFRATQLPLYLGHDNTAEYVAFKAWRFSMEAQNIELPDYQEDGPVINVSQEQYERAREASIESPVEQSSDGPDTSGEVELEIAG